MSAARRARAGRFARRPILRTVRIVLSGVARAEARFACGRNRIAKMLCGSNSAEVKKLGLHRLSTFGLLKHFKQDEVLLLIDALMAMRCMQQVDVDRFRPGGRADRVRRRSDARPRRLAGELPIPVELQRKLRAQRLGDSSPTAAQGVGNSLPTDAAANAIHPNKPAPTSIRPIPKSSMPSSVGEPRSPTRPACRFIASCRTATLAELARCRPMTREQLWPSRAWAR